MLKNNGKWEQNLWELVSHKAEFVWGPGLRSQEGINPCLKKNREVWYKSVKSSAEVKRNRAGNWDLIPPLLIAGALLHKQL